MAAGHNGTAIFIEEAASDTLYLNPVPTPDTSPDPPGDDPFGAIYVSSGGGLSPNVGHPYYRKPDNGLTFDLLQAAEIGVATFITLVNEPTLPNSRRLAVTSDLSLVDGGPQGTLTIGLSTANSAALASVISGSFVTALFEPGLPASRRLTAGTRISLSDGGALGPITVSVSGATDTLLTNLGSAPFLFPTNQAANFPQSRQVTAGANITITDNGAGGTFEIAAPGAIAVLGPVVHIMHYDFTDGFFPIPDAFAIAWTLYKVGRMVLATMAAGFWPSPSVLPGVVTTSLGTEFPAPFRPSIGLVLPCNIRQGPAALQSMSTHMFTAGGAMQFNWAGVQVWPNTLGGIPALSVAGGDANVFTWQGS